MGSVDKLLVQILRGASDANIRFQDVCNLLTHLGFEKRTRGSHTLFRKNGVEEKINLQKDGNKAKPYQVKQIRNLIVKYKLAGDENDSV